MVWRVVLFLSDFFFFWVFFFEEISCFVLFVLVYLFGLLQFCFVGPPGVYS